GENAWRRRYRHSRLRDQATGVHFERTPARNHAGPDLSPSAAHPSRRTCVPSRRGSRARREALARGPRSAAAREPRLDRPSTPERDLGALVRVAALVLAADHLALGAAARSLGRRDRIRGRNHGIGAILLLRLGAAQRADRAGPEGA